MEVVEDQQGAEVEVEEGGEEVELSLDTQLEEFRPIMELLADKQKPKKTWQKHRAPIDTSLNAQSAFVIPSLEFLLCL